MMPLHVPICKLDGKNFLGSQLICVLCSMPELSNSEATLPIVTCQTIWTNCYLAASQQHKQSSQQYETYCTEEKLDELFLKAFQLLHIEPLDNSMVVKPSGKHQVDVEPLYNPVVVKPLGKR